MYVEKVITPLVQAFVCLVICHKLDYSVGPTSICIFRSVLFLHDGRTFLGNYPITPTLGVFMETNDTSSNNSARLSLLSHLLLGQLISRTSGN